MASSDFGVENISEFAQESFYKVLKEEPLAFYEDKIYKILNKHHVPYKTDISKQEYIAARAAAQAVALNETRNTENAAVEIAVKATTASHEARKIKIKDLKRVHAKKHAKVAAKKKKIQWMY